MLLILLATVVPTPAQVSLRIPLEPGHAEQVVVVTFEENRVSAADVKRWMLLHENGFYSTPMIGYYPDCRASYIPKLESDVKKTQKIVDDLNSNEYPPELSNVVGYLKNMQSLWLWQAEQELAFLKRGQAPDTEYNGIDLGKCQVSIAPNRSQACHEVFIKWHSCVLDTMQRQLGRYPRQQWRAFLDAYGMRERVESTID